MMYKYFIAASCALTLCFVAPCQSQGEQGHVATPPVNEDLPVLTEDAARILISTKPTHLGGEPIALDITLKNVGTKGFRFFPEDAQVFYQIEVLGPGGKQVSRLSSYYYLHDNGELWGVGPNGSKTVTSWLSNIFDMTEQGHYKVTVSKKFRLGKDILTVRSEPLLLEVTSQVPTSEWH